jgi:hypothetical protein
VGAVHYQVEQEASSCLDLQGRTGINSGVRSLCLDCLPVFRSVSNETTTVNVPLVSNYSTLDCNENRFLCEADLGALLECRRGSTAVHLVCSRCVSLHTTETVCVTVGWGGRHFMSCYSRRPIVMVTWLKPLTPPRFSNTAHVFIQCGCGCVYSHTFGFSINITQNALHS